MGLFDWFKSNPLYIRYSDGSSFTTKNNTSYLDSNLMQIALENPVLYTGISIRANYLSKFKFYIEKSDGSRDYEADVLKLIENPNYYQSKEDFLKQYEWYRIVYGWTYQKPFGAKGFETKAIFNLNPSKCDFKDNKRPFINWKQKDLSEEKNLKFEYDDNGTTKTYKLSEVIPFYDTANGLTDCDYSFYKSPSRVKAIIKQVSNISLATDAENRVIQTNGREAIFRKSIGTNSNNITTNAKLPVSNDDKKDILFKLNTKYNMSKGSRTVIPDYPIEHLDMSINAKNLGLHESIIANSGLVIKALGLNNEIYNYYNKGATFENQDSAEVRFLQNVMQPVADDLASSWSSMLGLDEPIKATCEHVPTMQVIEEKKADRVLKISTALRNLTQSGLTQEQALQFMQDNGIKIE